MRTSGPISEGRRAGSQKPRRGDMISLSTHKYHQQSSPGTLPGKGSFPDLYNDKKSALKGYSSGQQSNSSTWAHSNDQPLLSSWTHTRIMPVPPAHPLLSSMSTPRSRHLSGTTTTSSNDFAARTTQSEVQKSYFTPQQLNSHPTTSHVHQNTENLAQHLSNYLNSEACDLFSNQKGTVLNEADARQLMNETETHEELHSILTILAETGNRFEDFDALLNGVKTMVSVRKEQTLLALERYKVFTYIMNESSIFRGSQTSVELTETIIDLLIEEAGGADTAIKVVKELDSRGCKFNSTIDLLSCFSKVDPYGRVGTFSNLYADNLKALLEFISSDKCRLFGPVVHNPPPKLIVERLVQEGGDLLMVHCNYLNDMRVTFESFQDFLAAILALNERAVHHKQELFEYLTDSSWIQLHGDGSITEVDVHRLYRDGKRKHIRCTAISIYPGRDRSPFYHTNPRRGRPGKYRVLEVLCGSQATQWSFKAYHHFKDIM